MYLIKLNGFKFTQEKYLKERFKLQDIKEKLFILPEKIDTLSAIFKYNIIQATSFRVKQKLLYMKVVGFINKISFKFWWAQLMI